MDWINLAQDSVQWRVLVNTVIKFVVAQKMIICCDICHHVRIVCVSAQIARAMNHLFGLRLFNDCVVSLIAYKAT
jgi:hypothetical protein